MGSNAADDADDQLISEKQQLKKLLVGSNSAPSPPTPTHNKEDSWPSFETADIHKVRFLCSIVVYNNIR